MGVLRANLGVIEGQNPLHGLIVLLLLLGVTSPRLVRLSFFEVRGLVSHLIEARLTIFYRAREERGAKRGQDATQRLSPSERGCAGAVVLLVDNSWHALGANHGCLSLDRAHLTSQNLVLSTLKI